MILKSKISQKSQKQKRQRETKNISPLQKSEQKSGLEGSKVEAKVNTKQLSGQLLSEQWNSSRRHLSQMSNVTIKGSTRHHPSISTLHRTLTIQTA